MNLPNQASRPTKFTNAQTVLYEMDMLKFNAGSFGKTNDGPDSWRNLECFLIHFRNLIEFFGNPQPRKDDLSILRPERIWADPATLPTPGELAALHREDLWRKYEVRDPTQVNDKISRYLQHCTEQRVDGKEWAVREMYRELESSMSAFEDLLPDKSRPWGVLPDSVIVFEGLAENYSTASSTPRVVAFVAPPSDVSKN